MKKGTPVKTKTARLAACLLPLGLLLLGAKYVDNLQFQAARETYLEKSKVEYQRAYAEAAREIEKAAKSPTPTTQTEEPSSLETWAVNAYQVEQAHQQKCWDQTDTRGYGDPGCY
jgi:hypothetical protein